MDEMEYSDDEAFVFKIEGKYGDRFPYSPTAITVSVDSDSISFGKGLNLKLVNGSWYESLLFTAQMWSFTVSKVNSSTDVYKL